MRSRSTDLFQIFCHLIFCVTGICDGFLTFPNRWCWSILIRYLANFYNILYYHVEFLVLTGSIEYLYELAYKLCDGNIGFQNIAVIAGNNLFTTNTVSNTVSILSQKVSIWCYFLDSLHCLSLTKNEYLKHSK